MVPRSTLWLTKQPKPYLCGWHLVLLGHWPIGLIHRLLVVCNMITLLVLRLCLAEILWSLRANFFEREVVQGIILVCNGLTKSSTTEWG